MRTAEEVAKFTLWNAYQLPKGNRLDAPLITDHRELFERIHEAWDEQTPDDLLSVIVEAIEADRAQRRGRLEGLIAYDSYEMDEDEGREVRRLIVDIDTAEAMGGIRVYINDGCVYDGNPEADEPGTAWARAKESH